MWCHVYVSYEIYVLHYTIHFLKDTSKMITSLSTKSRPPDHFTASNTPVPLALVSPALPWDIQAAGRNLTKKLSFTLQSDTNNQEIWCISDWATYSGPRILV